MIVAQITDCHISAPGRAIPGLIDTAARLAATVDYLNALRPLPDLVVATGDLTDQGGHADYARLREILDRLAMPYRVIPGNHDDRAELFAAFQSDGYLPRPGELPKPLEGDLHWVLHEGPMTLIGLDSVVPGQPRGYFSAARADWLERALCQRPDAPTLIFMHHPPFLTGQEVLDNIMCFGGDRLARVVSRYPQVEAILCGHHHQALTTRWSGVIAAVAPSTAYQIAVDLDGYGPARATFDPPACLIHRWDRGTGLVSRVAVTESVAAEGARMPTEAARPAEARGAIFGAAREPLPAAAE